MGRLALEAMKDFVDQKTVKMHGPSITQKHKPPVARRAIPGAGWFEEGSRPEIPFEFE
jgi:hypothetical protein